MYSRCVDIIVAYQVANFQPSQIESWSSIPSASRLSSKFHSSFIVCWNCSNLSLMFLVSTRPKMLICFSPKICFNLTYLHKEQTSLTFQTCRDINHGEVILYGGDDFQWEVHFSLPDNWRPILNALKKLDKAKGVLVIFVLSSAYSWPDFFVVTSCIYRGQIQFTTIPSIGLLAWGCDIWWYHVPYMEYDIKNRFLCIHFGMHGSSEAWERSYNINRP